MITVTAKAFHEKLNIEADEIILNGPPSFLTGNIFISNNDNETLFIKDLPISASKEGRGLPNMPTSFKFTTSLKAGEGKLHRIRHQLPPTTPPGTYESTIQVGGTEKKVKMIVQPNVQIDVHPLTVHFTGVIPGESYYTQLSFTNSGNMPFKVPDIKHVNTFDEDFLCRALSLAIREKGSEGYMATMDDLTRNINREMADWAIVKIEESGRTLEPGESIQLHLSLTLPKNVDENRDYFGTMRLWNKTLSYNIKSH